MLAEHVLWWTLFYAVIRVTCWIAVWVWALFWPTDKWHLIDIDQLVKDIETAAITKSEQQIDAEHF